MTSDAKLVPESDVERVRTVVEEVRAEILSISHDIAGDPELAYEEHHAAQRCADFLGSRGFEVQKPAYGLQTAFAARIGTRGPHVVVCAEYDALPEVGHACGHNVIAAAAMGAGAALAAMAAERGLRVTVLGTPAEEAGGGKVDLIQAGAFDGVDAALMIHPTPYDDHAPSTLAIEEWSVEFQGQAAHASASPELGRNALDGLVLGYTSVGLLRQHLRRGQQVHGVITNGGAAPNIVPESAAAEFYLRAITAEDLEDLRHRFRACMEGAAGATGTAVTLALTGHPYAPMQADLPLAEAFSAACLALGRAYSPDPEQGPRGSTDFGNVSQLVPSLHANLGVDCWPIVNHQSAFAAHCVSPAGDKAVLDGAMAMALTGLRIADDPSLLAGASTARPGS